MIQSPVPAVVESRRGDAIYMAHGYLTKVPVTAIIPFIEAFTQPSDLVVDPFAGSGMTGVAAAMTGRRAALSDISRLGQHIGMNYVNLVEPDALRHAAAQVLQSARRAVPAIYEVQCSHCNRSVELVKALWSKVYRCSSCDSCFAYFNALTADGSRPARCPTCGSAAERRRLDEVEERKVLEAVRCPTLRRQVEQPPTLTEPPRFPALERWPDVAIPPESEMFRRSALAKHGLTSTAAFFSRRNLTALVAVRDAISSVQDTRLRSKLLFAFTAILPRASKRYQWSAKRPLNAQNQTYYVSPVFYEWSVFDLFERKVEASIASDDLVRGYGPLFSPATDLSYTTASADRLTHLADGSVDYVFTDPPFGSNIFYSDMNLFQEAWLDNITDPSREAVIQTNDSSAASSKRYEAILTGALRECFRILKPHGWFSMVFSNSSGVVWAIASRALQRSGLELVPDYLSSIDKGQRSVKGLASGWEAVVTRDLVFTARKPRARQSAPLPTAPSQPLHQLIRTSVSQQDHNGNTPTDVYLRLVRLFIASNWDLEQLHFNEVLSVLRHMGYTQDRASGELTRVINENGDGFTEG